MSPDYARWRDRFAEALDPRFHPIGYLDRRVAEGSARVFACPEGALIVELRRYPTGRFDGHVLIAAGEIGAIVGRLREQAEEWLRGIGAAGAIVESRGGWARALKAHGYGAYQVAVRKDF